MQFDFRERVLAAFRMRNESEQLMKYNLCIDSMPTEDIVGLEQNQLMRISSNASATTAGTASADGDAAARMATTISELLHEVCTDYLRTQCKFMFDAALENADGAEEQAAAAEDGEQTGEAFRAMFTGMETPASQLATAAPAPEKGCIDTATEDFLGDVSDFAFASVLTQPEIPPLLYSIRCACEEVAVMRLFNCTVTRTLKLGDWSQIQSHQTAAALAHLTDRWAPGILNNIMAQLSDVGKGWFNLAETSRDVYQHSKLKRLLRVVTAMQQDALRYMVEDSVKEFTQFVQNGCKGSVEIKDAKTVISNDTRRFPLFQTDLICDGGKLGYAPAPTKLIAAVLQSFDEAFTSMGKIEQVEHKVMAHLLPHSREVLGTVAIEEPLPAECRQQLSDALERWLPETVAYMETFSRYKEFLESTIESHVEALSGEESTLNDVKKELNHHLKRADEVMTELPAAVTIGAFQINTFAVRAMLVEKHRSVVAALKSLVVKNAGDKCNEINEHFNEMMTQLSKPAHSPEHAQELRQYFKECESQIANLQPEVNELPAYYDFLDEFFYEMPEDDDALKWQTFTFSNKIMEQIETATESCEAAENEFQDSMVKQQGMFGSEIMHCNNVVSGYNQKLDTGTLDIMAAECKKFRKKLGDIDMQAKEFNAHEGIFGMDQTDYGQVGKLIKEFEPFAQMWETADSFVVHHELWLNGVFLDLDAEAIEKEVNDSTKTMIKTAKQFSMRDNCEGCVEICEKYKKEMEDFKPLLPMILALRNPGMRDRHWEQLSEEIGFTLKPDKHFKLQQCLDMNLMDHLEAIEKVGEVAGKEYMLETALQGMYKEWEGVELEILDYRETGTYILRGSEEMIQLIDDQITMTQAISFSPFKGVFEKEIDEWDDKLNIVSEVIDEWLACQRNWQYLEPIFGSEDIMKQLPLESTRFSTVDQKWRKNMANAKKNPGVVSFCASNKLLNDFQESLKLLELVNKGLNDYLETKRAGFARFYFLSNDELLEIRLGHLKQVVERRRLRHVFLDGLVMLGQVQTREPSVKRRVRRRPWQRRGPGEFEVLALLVRELRQLPLLN